MNFRTCLLATAATFVLCLTGCSGDNPGEWPIDQVEAQVVEGAALTEATLSQGDVPGQLTGTGKDAGGETFQLTVTQDAAAREFTWEAKGDRGTEAAGKYGK